MAKNTKRRKTLADKVAAGTAKPKLSRFAMKNNRTPTEVQGQFGQLPPQARPERMTVERLELDEQELADVVAAMRQLINNTRKQVEYGKTAGRKMPRLEALYAKLRAVQEQMEHALAM